jgi:imidazolonepropionase-like amidohydrolase
MLFGASIISTFMMASTSDQSSQAVASPHEFLALAGGTIFVNPTDQPLRDGVILIEGQKIIAVGSRAKVSVPGGARIIDCTGLTIMAGFWNSHVHFFERKWANAASIPAAELNRQLNQMFTRYGFTSVFDLASMWTNTRALRERIESGEVSGPRIRSTGEALVAPGAVPPERVLRFMGFMSFPAPEITTADQASSATRTLLEQGVDAIKVHLQPPPPPNQPFPASAIAAAVSEAHRAGKLVFVHPNTAADVMASVNAGVDVIAHTTPQSGPWEANLIAAMKEKSVALTPTLTLWKYYLRHDRVSTQEEMVNTAVGQLRAWLNAGGTVLFGTDIGAVDYDPSEEYALMAETGMNFRQILDSLTTAPAARFGDSKHSGRIEPGFGADLVIVRGDPAKDLHTLTAVEYTLKSGRIIYQT